MPPREACVLKDVLAYWAERQPEKTFAWFAAEDKWTYRQTLEIAQRAGAMFARLGVRQGENVLVWLPNGAEMLRAWFGLNWIGAVFVGLNIGYKGTILSGAIHRSEARTMVVHRDLVETLDSQTVGMLKCLIVIGGTQGLKVPGGLTMVDGALLAAPAEKAAVPDITVAPWHPQSIIFTSGTTGPSKAVLSSYLHLWSTAGPDVWSFLGPDDRMLVTLPLFHVGGEVSVYGMLCRGGSVVMIDYFQTETFWNVVDASGATITILVSAMLVFLLKQPPRTDDRDHSLKKVIAIPVQEATKAFAERFGVVTYTGYNMSEISTPIRSGANPDMPGYCGTARAGVELRIVDENDCEVPVGDVGELILRTDCPWELSSGYYNDPEATARSWRNGWFHTGDSFRKDQQGRYFFIDRKKDAIRRRGENISSFEVEGEACAHPHVREAAAVGVPCDLGEEEVLLAIAPVEGAVIEPGDLIDFLAGRMSHFMVPRFVRFFQELPKTPTGRVLKSTLREQGVTPDTWDREKAGKKIRRRRL